MEAEPVALHVIHPANDGTEGRIDLIHLHSLPITPGQEARLNLAVTETGQHPVVPTRLSLQ